MLSDDSNADFVGDAAGKGLHAGIARIVVMPC